LGLSIYYVRRHRWSARGCCSGGTGGAARCCSSGSAFFLRALPERIFSFSWIISFLRTWICGGTGRRWRCWRYCPCCTG
jgi:hypothetical protein